MENSQNRVKTHKWMHFILVINILSLIGVSSICSAQLSYQAMDFLSDEPEIQSSFMVNDNNSITSCFTPDCNYQIYGSWDNDSRLHFIDISGYPDRIGGGNFNITLPTLCSIVKITTEGQIVAVGGSWDQSTPAPHIYIVDVSNRMLVKQIDIPHQYFEISPDGEYLAVIDNNSYSAIYWTSNSTLYKKFIGNYGLLTFSPDGSYLAAFNESDNGRLDFLKFPEMTIILSIDGKPNFTLSPNRGGIISWSPDGEQLAVIISSKNIINIIKTSTWEVAGKIITTDDEFYFNFVSFSPEGGWLAVGGSTIEGIGVSLGLHIYDTEDWSRTYSEPNQIDYEEMVKQHYKPDDKYAIFDLIAWKNENSLYLSVTLYPGTIELNLDTDAEDDPDDIETGEKPRDEDNYVLIVGTGVSVFVILSLFGILAYLGILPNPLYSKLKPDELLNLETRNNIFGYIQEHPGCNFSDIKNSFEISNSNVNYHLWVLERENVIFSKYTGFKRNFYSTSYPRMSKTIPDQVEQGIPEKIFRLLLEQPGLTQKEIAANLGISESTVSRYIIDLMTENFIRRERDGNIWRCYAIKEE
ncbi:MAG: winged helix-turn-helix transcriptional regulator [Thermoplasmata archaeon]|nr:MAG: winged helix-turn-helix transcriptional regulator [Thermoplasmata archaeon]